MIKKRFLDLSVSRLSLRLMLFGLPIALLQLLFSVLELYFGNHPDAIYASILFFEMVEYVFLDILIVTIGAILLDVAVRDNER